MTINKIEFRRVGTLPATADDNTVYFVQDDSELPAWVDETSCAIVVTDNQSPPTGYIAAGGAIAAAAALSATNAETSAVAAASYAAAAGTSETNAESAESGALAAQAAAETARDAAFANADVYADIATGRAAVADTEQFMVVDGDEIIRYRRDSSSTQTEMARYPGAGLVLPQLRGPMLRGFDPATVNDVFTTNQSYFFLPDTLSDYDQFLVKVRARYNAIRSPNIVVAFVEADGSLTLVSQTQIAVQGGGNEIDAAVLVPAGCVLGIGGQTGLGFTAASQTFWSTPAAPTTSTAKSISTTNRLALEFTLFGVTQGRALTTAGRVDALEEAVGTTKLLGWADPLVATGSNAPAYAIVNQTPAQAPSRVSQFSVALNAASEITLVVCTMDGLTATIVRSQSFAGSAGVNVFDANLELGVGEYVGWSGTGVKFQNAANPEGITYWFKSGLLSSGQDLASSSQHRFECNWEISTGVFARITAEQDFDGFGLLSDADDNGVVDATAAFASAAGVHPHPYVPPGSFALTSISASGRGFWGPGKPYLNGQRFFLPRSPRPTNLLNGLRASMQEHITAGDVLTVIGDSVAHWFAASAASKHWFDMLTRFVNIGVAADEPAMTAFANVSTYTPAFYGLTLGGTTSIGTRGPLGQSLILADGASISFVGAYEQIDVHYTRDSGNGNLLFAYNGGAAFETLDTAGALALDQYSGPTLTGQAASGTYTLTASGGPVEITGLIRLGPRVASTATGPNRLRTLRASRGSYTFADFGATRVASILAQASYAGGKCVPIIALGINDSFETAQSTIVTNATALLDNLEAGGVDRIFAIPPMRPSAGWDSNYTGGRTYDAAAGAIRRLYRERGVTVLPLDAQDFANMGLFSDGLHPNDNGNDLMGQIIVEGLAG